MKTILALTISSLLSAGAYAQTTPHKPNRNIAESKAVVLDDSNRQAILSALGTSDEEKIAVVAKEPAKSQKTVVTETTTTVTPVKSAPVAAVVTPAKVEKPVVVTKTETVKKEINPINGAEQKTLDKVVEKKVVTTPKEVVTTQKTTEVKTEVVKKDTPAKVELKPVIDLKPVVAPENCVPPKKVVHRKKAVKHFTKVKVVKKTVVTNGFDLSKAPNSVSELPYESRAALLLQPKDVTANLRFAGDHSVLTLMTLNGQALPNDQLVLVDKNSEVAAYIANSNLNHITTQDINVMPNTTQYNINLPKEKACKILFVQYRLKSSNESTTLIEYFNKKGELSNTMDKSCDHVTGSDQDNVVYSSENNTTGIFINNSVINARTPFVYTVINNKNGKTFAPSDLHSFIVSKDFTTFHHVQPLERNSMTLTGTTYSKKLESGGYYVVAQFPGNKSEQRVIIEANIP